MASPVPDALGLRHGALIDEVIDAVALLLDAPVILTDPQHRLLAYSGRQEAADDPNRWVIVHRRLPDVTVDGLRRGGGEEQLRRSTDPVHIPAYPEHGNDPKLGVPIHAGGELRGVLWVHGAGEPTEEDRRRLTPAVHALGMALLRIAQYRSALRAGYTEDVRALLRGGGTPGAGEAAGRQGVAGHRLGVLALVPADGASTGVLDLERIRTALALYLAALHERSRTAVLDGAVYGIVPVPAGVPDGGDGAEHWLTGVAGDFLERADRARELVGGVGRVARSAEEVPLARKDADLAAYTLRSRPGDRSPRAVPLAAVRAEAVLLQAARAVAADHGRLDGPVAQRIARQLLKHRDRFAWDSWARYWLEEIVENLDNRDDAAKRARFTDWVENFVKAVHAHARRRNQPSSTTDAAQCALPPGPRRSADQMTLPTDSVTP
ncbi:hypothetical protein [Streptomyces sp. NPDC048277]|uniref:hypothetical protein n=1 Tax=Streptomyces sp. NPDC048277 TaxID=3155027 RepID=UPI0033D8AE1E